MADDLAHSTVGVTHILYRGRRYINASVKGEWTVDGSVLHHKLHNEAAPVPPTMMMDDERPREKMVAQYFIARNTLNLDPNTSALAVVGSLREIGCWNPSACVLAKPNPRDEDIWVAVVRLPANSFFEWKWIIVAPDRSTVYSWEERGNQNTVTGKMDGCFRNDWNEPTRYEAGLDLLYGLEIPEPGPVAKLPEIMVEEAVKDSTPSNDEEVTPDMKTPIDVESNAQPVPEEKQMLSDIAPVSPTEPEAGPTPPEIETFTNGEPVSPGAQTVTTFEQELIPPQVNNITNVTSLPPEPEVINKVENELSDATEIVSKGQIHLNTKMRDDETKSQSDANKRISDDKNTYPYGNTGNNDNDSNTTKDTRIVGISLEENHFGEDERASSANTNEATQFNDNSRELLSNLSDQTSSCAKTQTEEKTVCDVIEPQEHPVEIAICNAPVKVEIAPQLQNGGRSRTEDEILASIVSDFKESESLSDSIATDIDDSTKEIVSDIMEKDSEELCEKPPTEFRSEEQPVCDMFPQNIYKILTKPVRGPYIVENISSEGNEQTSEDFLKTTDSPTTSLDSETSELDSENTNDGIKTPGQQDTDPLLNDTEPTSDSNQQIGDIPRGECGNFLSRMLEWACNIL
ncbi:hypothetical protein ScPMuIL_006829 [Solemya velum]